MSSNSHTKISHVNAYTWLLLDELCRNLIPLNIKDFKVYAEAEQLIKPTKLPKIEKKSLELKRMENPKEITFAKVIFKLTIGPNLNPANLLNGVKKGLEDANPLSTTNKAKMMMKTFC